jgi:hypothetical protein
MRVDFTDSGTQLADRYSEEHTIRTINFQVNKVGATISLLGESYARCLT